MWNAHHIEIGQNGQTGHSLDSEGDFVPTQMKCFLTCFVSAMECLCRCLTSQKNSLHYTALIKFVWNARRIEIGQNGQNGHSLESEGDFVFTQMSCFFTHFVSVMECLCICAT